MHHQLPKPNFLKSNDSMNNVIPSTITQKANTNGRETITAGLLQRKKIPRKICNKPDNIRVPLFGRNCCVLKVNIRVKIPESRTMHPNNQALANSVSTGLQMHNTPSAIRAMPAMASQIFVLFS